MLLGRLLWWELRDNTQSYTIGSVCISTEVFPSITVRERKLMLQRRLAANESVLLRLARAKSVEQNFCHGLSSTFIRGGLNVQEKFWKGDVWRLKMRGWHCSSTAWYRRAALGLRWSSNATCGRCGRYVLGLSRCFWRKKDDHASERSWKNDARVRMTLDVELLAEQ